MRPQRVQRRHSPHSSHGGALARCANNKLVLFGAGIFCIAAFSFVPILLLERMANESSSSTAASSSSIPRMSVEHAIHGGDGGGGAAQSPVQQQRKVQQSQNAKVDSTGALVLPKKQEDAAVKPPPSSSSTGSKTRTTKDGRTILDVSIGDLVSDPAVSPATPVARGVAGAPLSETPALVGAQRAHIQCDALNVDSFAYWNDPIGTRDLNFQSPFAASGDDDEYYISFAPDRGGWNNVRMSMEIIFVIAAATGRTLVLPPKEPLYLLHHDAASRHRGFADFFPIHTPQFQAQVKVISFEEFLQRQTGGDMASNPLAPTAEQLPALQKAADHCDKRDKAEANCKSVFTYLASKGHSPEISAAHTCLVFDETKYTKGVSAPLSNATQDHLDTYCGEKREQFYWDAELNHHRLIHFRASEKQFRLLTHFYSMIHFTNPAIDHYYKRFVRDFLHYHDSIYCAAGKIIKAVQLEGGGSYSALHVRRGDLQYKKVKIPAAEWYENTKEVWKPKELLYIATDERDKSFFDDLAKHHDLRFLDDYWDLAQLGDLDPNYMGMIDTIVASQGRAFAGTWFSTFSGYINRLRGYAGKTMQDSWYSFLSRKTAMHEWKIVDDMAYAFEWPDGWAGIDRDEFPSRDVF